MTMIDSMQKPPHLTTTAQPSDIAPADDATTETAAEPAPRQRTLLDELAQAEAEHPDPIAIARADLSEIIGRADCPQPGDGQRLLEHAGTLGIGRKTLRAAIETVAINSQRDKVQAEVGRLEIRQALLAGEIGDLEAKRGALELDDGYAKLHRAGGRFCRPCVKESHRY